MNVLSVPVALVDLPASGRPVSKETVVALASSIGEVGLINPITVIRATVFRCGEQREGFRLVCGRHRFEAVCGLGMDEVQANVIDGDDTLRAELIEIDENLNRNELSPAQRAASIKRRKEIWEVLHPNTGTSCPSIPRGRGQPEQFAADTAKAGGESKRDVNRHIARAEALGSDIHAVIGTSLDKGVELDALKELPAEKRSELIERARSGEQVSAREVPADDRNKRLVTQCLAELERVARQVPAEDLRRLLRNIAVSFEAAGVAGQFAAKSAKAA
jgi:hypothetical protein